MPTTKQRRQSARRRLQRQIDKRRAAAHRRKQRNLIVATVVSVVVVLAGAAFAVNQWVLDDDSNGTSDDAQSQPSTPPEDREALPARTPEPIAQRAPKSTNGPCKYAETAQTLANPSAFDVGLPPDPKTTPNTGTATVTMQTNKGTVKLSMDRAAAPCTVQSFLYLAGKQFFDNTACPRSVNSGIFVVQCGDPSATTGGGPTYQFKDENLTKADYSAGAVAMANGGPNTNSSGFFMIFNDSNGGLQKSYTSFAKITEGLDIVKGIGEGGDDGSNQAGGGRPNQDFIIEKVTVDK